MRLPEKYVRVVVDRPAEALDRYFTYRLPPHLSGQVQLGSCVLVPFGHEQLPGFVVGLSGETEVLPEQLKEVLAVVGEFPLFDASRLRLAQRLAAYYRCHLIEALHCLVPEGLSRHLERVVTWTGPRPPQELAAELESRAPQQATLMRALAERGGRATRKELRQALVDAGLKRAGAALGSPLKALKAKGLVAEEFVLRPPRVRAKTERVAALSDRALFVEEEISRLERRAPRQAAVLKTLVGAGGPLPVAELVRRSGAKYEVVQRLVARGLVSLHEREVRRPAPGGWGVRAPQVKLTPEQHEALQVIRQALAGPERRPVLLYGVTASGKTEVYLQALAQVLDQGRQCIVLVPEISLTAQTIDIFRHRFGDRVAVLHSALAAGERYDEWRRAHRGEVDIVVGARSAIFAPLPEVGLIILDEEHETSYKQDTTPRYHARRVALWRAEESGAGLILGSATPDVESFYRAQQGEYALAKMKSRIEQRPLARVEIVDMRAEDREKPHRFLSARLVEAMRQRLACREQVILFLNRRGFSTFVLCRDCGYTIKCPNCDISLVLHLDTGQMHCHHCDVHGPAPKVCPNCRGTRIGYLGFGTERIAEEVQEVLPQARVLRLDRDTTTRKNAHAQILGQFQRREAEVLVGTQMVAKGLDFENVTLVGVISADVALNIPEYRAGERTFQLLTQVSGRAGRGDKEGLVIIQTYNPDHYAIRAAQRQDFEQFYAQEIEHRRHPPYPPFVTLANLLVADRDAQAAQTRAEHIAARLGVSFLQTKAKGQVLGPAPAPLAKLRGLYRWHILVKAADPETLQGVLEDLSGRLTSELRTGLTIDVEPLNMM